MRIAIKVENVSKQYRLGKVGTGTIAHDLNRWWHLVRGKEDPYLKIGDVNDRTSKGDTDYVWALRGIDFEIEQGDAVGIIGRNGAGKSTLLKILSRTTAPTTGNLRLRGRVASLLEVGTGFHPELSGRENIFLNGAILGMTKKEITRKFDEIVDFSGVERYIDTPVKRYSSGMYVRLAFAVAAHLESEILIVDEVLAVGDAEFQKKCLGKMGDVSRGEGRTVLFVSHNMAAVEGLCSKSIVLEHGLCVFKGTQKEGIKKYLGGNTNNTTSSISWQLHEAPGDHRARLLAVEAVPTVGDFINFSSGITLRFTVQSFIEKALLDVSFDIKNHDHVLMVHHGKYVSDYDMLAPKCYVLKVDLQPYIFNEGQYSVDVWLGLGATEIVGEKLRDVISFNLETCEIDHIKKKTPGLLRPKLNYSVSEIN